MKEKITCSCIVCKRELSIKGIATHYNRAHGPAEVQQKYSSGHNGRYNDESFRAALKEGIKQGNERALGKLTDFTVQCAKCNTSFIVTEREKQHPLKNAYYCSRSCANSKQHSEETKRKQSAAATLNNARRYPKVTLLHNCRQCNKLIVTSRKYCNKECMISFNRAKRLETLTSKAAYRRMCNFTFNLADYPEDFDFELIQEHGWYSPANKKNNLTGVSRDHMVSVMYGFKNNIPWEHISHPANCQLLVHGANVSKGQSNAITYAELLQRIDKWDKKYR